MMNLRLFLDLRCCWVGLLALPLWTGCSAPDPVWAADEPSLAVQRETGETGRLDSEDRARIERTLAGLAADHEPSRRPASASRGIRWDDLPSAVTDACAEVQMAVVRSEPIDDGIRFELWAIEDRPGSLTVRPLDSAPYYTAEARIGRFNDEPERVKALLNALDRSWRAWGRKKRLE